jgi:hypothetical protein
MPDEIKAGDVVQLKSGSCLTALADCPTTSICPDDGQNGNPTGQYKWQGAIEFAQFSHPLMNGGKHTWWERCN